MGGEGFQSVGTCKNQIFHQLCFTVRERHVDLGEVETPREVQQLAYGRVGRPKQYQVEGAGELGWCQRSLPQVYATLGRNVKQP